MTASDYEDWRWDNPRLGSALGWHHGMPIGNKESWANTAFPNYQQGELYQVNKFSMQKRGDGGWQYEIMDAMKIKYKDANGNWVCYHNCDWISTGNQMKVESPMNQIFDVHLDEFIASEVRFFVHKNHF